MLHDLVTMAVAGLIFLGIISPRVHTGLLASCGMGVLFVAALWSLDDWAPGPTVVDTMLGGIGLIALEVAYRVLRKPRAGKLRRATDWTQTRPLRELPPDQQHQVAGGRGAP